MLKIINKLTWGASNVTFLLTIRAQTFPEWNNKVLAIYFFDGHIELDKFC